MVQMKRAAVALVVGSAVAAPQFTLPALSDFLKSFTLPAYKGASSTAALPGYGSGASSSSSAALPGYGGGASTSSAAVSPSKSTTSSGASKPVSSILPTGSSTAKVSSISATGGTAVVTTSYSHQVGRGTSSVYPHVPSGSGISTTEGNGTEGTATTSFSYQVGRGTSSVYPHVPSGSGISTVTTSFSYQVGRGTSSVYPHVPSGSGISTSKTGVSVGPVPGSSKTPSTGTSPAGSGASPVGTGKTTVSSKSSALGTSPVGTGKTTVPSKSSALGTSPAGTGKTTVSSKTSALGTSPAGTGKTTVSSKSACKSKPASSGASGSPASSGSPKPPSTTGSSPLPTVSTSSGQVVGYLAPNTSDVYNYLGIKFAEAPVGDLRFAPPVAYTGTGLINGSTFADDCPCTNLNVPFGLDPRLSSLLNTLAQTNSSLAEDCLFVNVWAKAGSSNKPVLVWIYGGGFNFGGTNSAAYNGRYFANDEDVVFVSFNYRTNVLGFSGAPGITQNVGLLDQRLAIEWIRDNIAAFGGDPSRITIFGQSAGGASVDLYTFSHYEDPIIAGAIPMSGAATSFGLRTADQALAKWDNVTYYLGCGNSSDTPAETVLSCMRSPNITWEAIENIAQAKPGLNSLLGNFGPTVDEKIVFSNYTGRAVDGRVAQIPTLTGNTNYESGLLSLIAIGAGESYPQSTWDYIDLQIFTCPVSRTARYRGSAGVPTWRYLYSGAWPNLVLPTANLSQAWHISDIPVLFGVADEITLTANTANETLLGDYMRGVWADFAADPYSLDSKYGWPRYSTGELIDLGKYSETSGSFSNASAIEVGCQF